MRILVSSSAAPDAGSGINAYAVQLSEALAERGVEVHFLSPTPNDRSWLERHKIRHVATELDDDPFEAAMRVLKHCSCHGVEGAINNDNPVLQSIAPALSFPMIAIGHMARTSVATLACYNHEWVDHVVTISSDMQRTYVRRFGVPLTKCPIVYNGVGDPGHDGDFSLANAKELRVVYAGGYNRVKGGDLLLKTVLGHREKWRGMRLDWFGIMPERLTRRLSEVSFVNIHGRVPRADFHAALRGADVFLLPSRREGCPMAMLEAMSFGVLPIASDGTGAMRWLITSGQEGFICQLDRFAEQLMSCLTYLRDHPERVEELKRASRERFMKDFRRETATDHLLRLLRSPTVDRRRLARRLRILRWHRPVLPHSLKAPLLDRLCIRAGWLRSAGTLSLPEPEQGQQL